MKKPDQVPQPIGPSLTLAQARRSQASRARPSGIDVEHARAGPAQSDAAEQGSLLLGSIYVPAHYSSEQVGHAAEAVEELAVDVGVHFVRHEGRSAEGQ
jgi:hypothetical protein